MSATYENKILTKNSWKPPAFLLKKNRFKLYLLRHLPMALLAGIKPIEVNFNSAHVSLPFTYLTKNPFKSIYFACQCMASELSTGILCMAHQMNTNQKLSLLVVNMEATFSQKAKEKTYFRCTQGAHIAETINRTIKTKEPHTVTVQSIATDESGTNIARFSYTWSFKVTQPQ